MIQIFLTGGTIDGLHYDDPKKKPANHQSLIPAFLEQGRVDAEYKLETILKTDSRFITAADQQMILQKCHECHESRIVITYGTITMTEMAKLLGQASIPKTIILTGAAILGTRSDSDALFNLGGAITAVQILLPGVYIIMNGKVFSWKNVRKNVETVRFEEEH